MGRETLSATLRSLERQTMMPYEVLVVNQGPKDVEVREQWNLPIKWLHQDARGLSRARNRALDEFSGDWVLFTDDDQEVNAEWVEQLVSLASLYPEASIIGGAVFPPTRYDSEALFVSEMYVHGEVLICRENYLQPGIAPHVQNDIWGGNFALSRACIEKVGRYDEAFGRGSGVFEVGEDTDYMMRVISSGLTGLLSCRLIIYHTYGTRPHGPQNTDELIEMCAALHWKASQDGSPIEREIARRIHPYGKKKAMASRLTGGKLFGDEAHRQAIFDEKTAMLNQGWTLSGGCLKRKEQ